MVVVSPACGSVRFSCLLALVRAEAERLATNRTVANLILRWPTNCLDLAKRLEYLLTNSTKTPFSTQIISQANFKKSLS